jgi:hypothetical protein
MKTRTKIAVTLSVGISLLIGSTGVALASPHYTDWGGSSGIAKTPVTTFDSAKSVEKKVSPLQHNQGQTNVHRSRISFEDFSLGSDVVNIVNDSTFDVSDDKGRPDGIWTTGGTASLTRGLSLHDSVHCLSNIKSEVLRKRGLALHDSIHCLHNNGAFLPVNPIQVMKLR